MVSVPGGCVAMPSLSGGSAERLGLDVERLRQPLENHRRRNTLDLPALEDGKGRWPGPVTTEGTTRPEGGSGLSGSERARGDRTVVKWRNRRDDDAIGAELDPGDLTNEPRARGDQGDDIVEIIVVVHAPDPGRIRRAGLGDRGENADDPHEQQG